MDVATINAKGDAAVAAIEAGDYSTAEKLLVAASTMIALLPNVARSDKSLTWDRAAIQAALNQIKQLKSSRRGFKSMAVNVVRPSCSDCCDCGDQY